MDVVQCPIWGINGVHTDEYFIIVAYINSSMTVQVCQLRLRHCPSIACGFSDYHISAYYRKIDCRSSYMVPTI